MASPYHRLTQTRRRINIATGLAMLAGLIVVFLSLAFGKEGADRISGELIGGMALFFLGGLAAGVCELLLKIEANSHRIHELFIEVRGAQERQGELLEIMSSNSQISLGPDVDRLSLRFSILTQHAVHGQYIVDHQRCRRIPDQRREPTQMLLS